VHLPNTEWLASDSVDTTPRFTHLDGLSSNAVMAFLEDREGNIWVSTQTGIDRFRRRNVYPAPFVAGSSDTDLALAADQNGALWAEAQGQPLLMIKNDLVSAMGPPRHICAIYRDRAGVLWIGGEGRLTKFVDRRFVDVPLPELRNPANYWKVRAIAEDGSGSLWISIVEHGVFRLRNKHWERYGNLPGLPQSTAFTIFSDSIGEVWFGYIDNRIALSHGTAVRTFSSAEGLDLGAVTAFGGRAGHLWAAGHSGGLARFEGARFSMLASATDGEFKGISGIVETDNGDLWLNEEYGIAHITAEEIEAKLREPHHKLKFELFDSRDGLRGTATQMNFLPSAVLGTDGRIWVSETGGAFWIDPARLYRNAMPPPVSIQSLVVDGKVHPTGGQIQLPALSSNLQIDYAALSLSIPERVHFRYKLESIDKDWQDVGTRRSAFYMRPGPGSYRFRVIAANNDGVWNETGASLDFLIAPAFYQTWWFRLFCIALAVAGLWQFYLYRLNLATAKIQERIGARLEERERIARELHDTLLQGFQGLVLRFHAVLNTLSHEDPARTMVEKALNRADQVLTEGRQRVRELRAEGMTGEDLPKHLERYGEELAQEHKIHFNLSVTGTPRALDPIVFNEIYRIAQEGLTNAFLHSHGSKIEVELIYDDLGARLNIRDDGEGIGPEVIAKGRAGHWGLSGMRERAQKIGARLNLSSRPGGGTEIDLAVPARIAYLTGSKQSLWARLKRFGG
jgi:signal transduction histidine kinase